MSSVAFLFPGQGAQGPRMLDEVRPLASFHRYHDAIRDLAGVDIGALVAAADPAVLERNLVSSLATMLVSLVLHDEWRRQGGPAPCCVAGYSIGQWTALHVAGVVDLPALIRIVAFRAACMDDCVRGERSGMYAVLGLPLARVEAVLNDLSAAGHPVYVSNLNCTGNYSIAGSIAALAAAVPLLAAAGAKKLWPVPVSGAWHSPLLAPAQARFAAYLRDIDLAPAAVPVVDNVTGGWLPSDPSRLRVRLAEHVARAVRWDDGVRQCRTLANRFVEFGFGDSLTRLGFFIDRHATFERFRTGGAVSAVGERRPQAAAG